MSHVRPIPEEHVKDFITIVANAYPGLNLTTEEDRQKFEQRLTKMLEEEETAHLYGLYREGILLGGMILHDFMMNLFNVRTLAGGVGLVAVDLIHKKEKVCKDMIAYFLGHYKEKGSCIACLYPFRPDFYKEMGFGFGTRMHQYRVNPHQLPKTVKDHIQFMSKSDRHAVLECYHRYAEKTHGMMERSERYFDRIFDDPEYRIVGYRKGGKVMGYIIFSFKKGDAENFIINDIHIKEFIYETKEALSELLTFLHTQDDQIRYIFINTQDEYFYHLFPDPRNHSDHLIPEVYHETNVAGTGLMYRVIDTEQVFTILRDHNFGNQNCRINLRIGDSFFKENERALVVHFEGGIPHLGRKDYDVEISLDVSDFSSLVMGVVPFRRLYQYGLAEISDPHRIDLVDRIFRSEEKPVCTTEF